MTRLALGLLFVAFGCDRAEHTAAAVPSATSLADRAGDALVARDADALAALASEDGTVRIEIRQALVETDERETEVVEGALALHRWAERVAAEAACEGCRWPHGIVRSGERRCFGDCCDWGAGPREVTEGTLRVQRICLANRDERAPRLSYVGLLEAR